MILLLTMKYCSLIGTLIVKILIATIKLIAMHHSNIKPFIRLLLGNAEAREVVSLTYSAKNG